MKTYLVICPTHRDVREIARLTPTNARFHEYASIAMENNIGCGAPLPRSLTDPLDEIEKIVSRFEAESISGIFSTDDYPGTAIARRSP